jgi:arylsulfatase
LQRGFDKFWGFLEGTSTYFDPAALTENNQHSPPVKDPTFYLTDAIADHAIGFLDEFAREKKPFFLYCAFNAPHWPIQAPEPLIEKYADRYAGGWDKLREERHAKQLVAGIVRPEWKLTARDQRVPAWEIAEDKAWEMRRMATYAAMIDRLDHNIGRIVDEVERAGIADNTLILFLSDNGGNAEEIKPIPVDGTSIRHGNDPHYLPGSATTWQSIGIPWGNCANTPFRLYKHYAHEGGISTPFIAVWPRVIQPQQRPISAPGHETDLMPTFLEAAGATYPASSAAGALPKLAGESLLPIFKGKGRTRGPMFWEHEGNKAVRDGKWKLVSRFPVGWELYDMEADRTETHDLAGDMPDQVERMEALYQAWAARIGVQPWPMAQTPKSQSTGDLVVPGYLGGKDLN